MPLPPKPYEWVAFYHNHEYLYQEDPETGVVSNSEQIDRSRLSHFVLYGPNSSALVTQYFDEGMRFFYRRRTEKSSNENGASNVCHIIGWYRYLFTDAGTPFKVQHVTYVLEHNIAVGRFAPVVFNAGAPRPHKWFYDVVPCAADEVPVGVVGKVEHQTDVQLQSRGRE